MERICNVTAMMTVKEGPPMSGIDVEEMHEREEVDIPALIRNIEAAEETRAFYRTGHAQLPSVASAKVRGGRVDALGGSSLKPDGTPAHLRRLTEYKLKAGDVSSVLAWDDLTLMRLDAGHVKEA
ncbi:hypothetical protein N9L68_05510 [bacterium]|nr:hypothetical protein [bacterium]